ncbi:ABC transporter ATP-binding protein [Acidisphaera sp. L21]|uniref:ABC transporter ATP-binding protein n=1 Tax=Acidisphaera sp. L21 TaxID=1641851 RepID=UPI00131AA75A|nr:ABC transporter ATP-binding protein [Acidisphaera sp. L21]
MSGPYLDVTGVSKRFGGLQALDDCSFAIEPGQITCLVGPNGAGKTSVFNVITGFIRPDAGQVRFRGQVLTRMGSRRIVGLGICRSFQNLRLFADLSVLDNVTVYLPSRTDENPFRPILRPIRTEIERKRRMAAAMSILEEVGLAHRARDAVRNLSYGEQKLLCVARLMASGAELLLLDEPTSGLSAQALEAMIALVLRLKAAGRTFLVVEHNTRIVQRLADSVVFLHQGHVLAQGEPAAIVADPKLGEIYFGGAL